MSLKNKLKLNQLTVGTWLTIGHPNVAEILASTDVDWIAIDIEHTTISLDTLQTLILIIQSKGVKALVRISSSNEVIVKRVLDAGADGLIVPMIKNNEEAKRLVSYAKYPPTGKRGVGLYRAQDYGESFIQYKQWQESDLVIIAQIEHIEAAENLESIMEVDGIDGGIIGPYDLSASMGRPGEFESTEVIDVINDVVRKSLDNNFPIGLHVIKPDPKELLDTIEKGYTFVAYSLDFFFLKDRLKTDLQLLDSRRNRQ